MPNRNRTLLLAAVLCPELLASIASSVPAQPLAPGDVDLSFDPGSGVNGPVGLIVIQPDGKIIIDVAMTMVRGVPCQHIARLNADGSLDGTFNPAHGTGYVDGFPCTATLALQPDGKVVVPGHYYLGKDGDGNDVSHRGVFRLHPDGSLDLSFIPRFEPAMDGTFSVALQPDGKVLVCGGIFAFHGVLRAYVARLHGDSAPRFNFLRGDCNGDARLDLSDAVCILNWLFLAGASPGCVAATNTDGVGAVDLTDPIYLLTHLFLGGRAFVAPRIPPVEPGRCRKTRGPARHRRRTVCRSFSLSTPTEGTVLQGDFPCAHRS